MTQRPNVSTRRIMNYFEPFPGILSVYLPSLMPFVYLIADDENDVTLLGLLCGRFGLEKTEEKSESDIIT